MAEENAPVEVAAPVAAPTPVLGEPMDLMTALQLVMKKSSAHDGLVKGLREAAKAIEKHAAQICVLAEDCDQPDYVKLVKALCAEHNVHLVTVPSAKTLGEWAGVSILVHLLSNIYISPKFHLIFIFIYTSCSFAKRNLH
uniref:40S ribosomal protein S12 n=1 Tax=Triticum urartu TaxID=4572 RepID=A0A8R7QGR1_TRIUA